MKNTLLFLLAMIVFCQCDDSHQNPVDIALSKACKVCDMTPSEMTWLREAILTSEQETSSDFYTAFDDETPIIIQQPHLMSCFACLRFSCEGDTLKDHSTFISSAKKIYEGKK